MEKADQSPCLPITTHKYIQEKIYIRKAKKKKKIEELSFLNTINSRLVTIATFMGKLHTLILLKNNRCLLITVSVLLKRPF